VVDAAAVDDDDEEEAIDAETTEDESI